MINYQDLTIVAIGSSAGGLESLQKFLSKLPQNPAISYVIVQHLDPKRNTLFGELLNKFSSFHIKPIKNKETILPNHIYYCPPNNDVIIKNGIFILSKPLNNSFPKPSINKFFASLALEKKEKAIGIILSGTGSDGVKGIIEISKYGGIVLTEDEGAKYYSMPKAAIDTGKVLASLPPELLAEGIEHIINDRKYFDKYLPSQSSIEKIFTLLNKTTGIDFTLYKKATIKRRIKRRINETKAENVDNYLKLLQKDEKEIERLKDELLIIVTSFFRDKEAFLELKKHLKELLIKTNESIRIWVPACATGEEAYSIAILIREIFEELQIDKKVHIFATDISDKIIKKARNKSFKLEEINDINTQYITKYFEYKNGSYKPKKILRDMIVFSKHDIIKDPPFLNLDLISCRNLLIYFDTELQKRILSIFYYALRQNGLLFLGKSESIGSLHSLFLLLHNKYKIYKKSNNLSKIDINTLTYIKKVKEMKQSNKKQTDILDIDIAINKAVSTKYAKNGVIIDANNKILFYKGNCREFINLPQGLQTNDIYKLIADYLKFDIQTTINEAKKEKAIAISKQILVLPISNPKEYVTIEVFPLEKNKLGDETFFITFHKSTTPIDNIFEPITKEGRKLSDFENELLTLNEKLHKAYDELQLTNEKLEIANEELQTTNEELETSNEELQSTNEELETVNEELRILNYNLEFMNKAFNNVLENISADVMILDLNLNIIKYTSGINKFFNISNKDENFSTVLINSTINLPHLMDDLKKLLLNDEEINYDIDFNNKNYHFVVKKIDLSVDKINPNEGIVLSFVDKTEITQKDAILFQQSKMASMGEMIANIAHQWRQPLNALNILNSHIVKKFKDKTIDDEFVDNFSEKSKKLINKMSSTIDDFRNFFNPRKNKETFDINSLIIDVKTFMMDSFINNNITFEVSKIDKLTLTTFRNELMQVLIIILNNSKDAIKSRNIRNGHIYMNIKKDDKCVVFTITDNGGGVEENILNKIFEPYFTTKFENEGTGIGLYMAKMIIEESMNGSLSLENVNNGAKTTIKIPLKDIND